MSQKPFLCYVLSPALCWPGVGMFSAALQSHHRQQPWFSLCGFGWSGFIINNKLHSWVFWQACIGFEALRMLFCGEKAANRPTLGDALMSGLGSSAMKEILVYAITCKWQEAPSVSKRLKNQYKVLVISFLKVLFNWLYSLFNESCIHF